LKAHNSLYMMISQTRDNIGVTFGETKSFSGGNAVKFYRVHEIWLAVETPITREVRGKKRHVGSNVIAKVKKNKLTGKVRFVKFPVYDDYGVDDVGSMVDWLVEEGFWAREKGKQIITTEDPFVDGIRDKVIRHIEENNLEGALKKVAQECWIELEGATETKRKPRY
jgi:recA bacterial DNA recombination protein